MHPILADWRRFGAYLFAWALVGTLVAAELVIAAPVRVGRGARLRRGNAILDFRFGDARSARLEISWRRTQQGAVIYCAFEGQSGIEARVEAFRQKHLAEDHDDIPFYIEPVTSILCASTAN